MKFWKKELNPVTIKREGEKTILNATDPKYKYITRDVNGYLYLSTNKPSFYKGHLNVTKGLVCFNAFDSLFKEVKSGDEPICFRKQILDDVEKEYLKAVFKPFAKRIEYAEKTLWGNEYYIRADLSGNDYMSFPSFKGEKTMYKEMETGKHYTLKELGIIYGS